MVTGTAMSNLAFTLILVSACMHAIWNLLVKRSHHKTVFIWWMFIASGGLYTAIITMLPEPISFPDRYTVLMALIGAICFVLYHLFNGRAYRGGDLSVVYPLSQTAMVYVPFWGFLLLNEHISLAGMAGILLVLSGTYAIQLQSLSCRDALRPFLNLKSPSVRDALAAGFIYSIGSIAEKSGVKNYSPLYFTYILVMMMLLFMSANMLRPKYKPLITAEFKENWRLILLSGPVMMISFLTFRYGLNLSPVSYAVPVRQVSTVIGVLIGVMFLKESYGRIRIISALLILSGVVMIRLG